MNEPEDPAAAPVDVVVIGAGFGGLGAALALAERGARVVVLEAMTYPGGCASTFERGGVRYESGATLFSGFGAGQLFDRWTRRHALDVDFRALDPVIELRAPGLALDVPARRERLVHALAALPGAPRDALHRFFALQARTADLLWPALDDPALLPPFGKGAIRRHLARLPAYASLLTLAGRPLGRVLAHHGLDRFAPLRVLAEALCRITVQCGADEAEAPIALAALDYPFRGAGHVTGGIGRFADQVVAAIRRQGGDVRFAARATALAREGDVWRVTTRRGTHRARNVVANLLPQDLVRLLGTDAEVLGGLAREVEGGWGAAMLYLVAKAPEGAPERARHAELVQDAAAPFTEGNHLFASIADAADDRGTPAGCRTITVSTHVAMSAFAAMDDAGRARHAAMVQARLREGLARFLPEWSDGIVSAMTASPRTFERFTSRAGGHVGGVPRRAGWRVYRRIAPCEVARGLWLAGDSVFPGQSALAVAVGGVKVAEAVTRSR